MSHRDQPDISLLERYIAGDASPEEWALVEANVLKGQQAQELVAQLRSLRAGPYKTPDQVDVDGALRKVLAGKGVTARRHGLLSTALSRWVGYAAAAAVICIITFQTFNNRSTSATHQVYKTTRGQRVTVTLPEGAQIILGPATQLDVFGSKVVLSGQAAFTILHHKDAPFSVQVGSTTTHILGTSFVIRQYDDDEAISFAVADGKISVNSTVLAAGDVAAAFGGSQIVVKHDAEAMLNAFAFSQGKLVISAQSLAAAAPELSRWFDLDIHIDRDIANRRLSATLHNHTPAQALDQIALLTETRYHRNGRVVTFTRN